MVRFSRERLFAPVSVPCYNWTGLDGNPQRKTAIIAPVRIIECEDGSMQISWACNRGPYCRDQNCRYSHTTQETPINTPTFSNVNSNKNSRNKPKNRSKRKAGIPPA